MDVAYCTTLSLSLSLSMSLETRDDADGNVEVWLLIVDVSCLGFDGMGFWLGGDRVTANGSLDRYDTWIGMGTK